MTFYITFYEEGAASYFASTLLLLLSLLLLQLSLLLAATVAAAVDVCDATARAFVHSPPVLIFVVKIVGPTKHVLLSAGRGGTEGGAQAVQALSALQGLFQVRGRHLPPLRQSLLEIAAFLYLLQLSNRGRRGGHADGEERAGQPGAVGEAHDALPGKRGAFVVDQGEQTCVQGGRVGVADVLGKQGAGSDLRNVTHIRPKHKHDS